MDEYPKIDSVYQRDPETKHRYFIDGAFSTPEFEYLATAEWVWTEKVDGTNIRVGFDPDGQIMYGGPPEATVTFGGRTDNAQIPTHLLTALQATFPILKLAEVFKDTSVCLYGEGYGAKIQKGGDYREDQGFILFDVKVGNFWLYREDIENIANKLGIPIVPIIGSGTLYEMTVRAMDGFESFVSDKPRLAEGIVAYPKVQLFNRFGKRIITKVKHKDFPKETC